MAHLDWIRSKLLISADNVEREIFWNEDVQEYITFKLHDEAREAIAIVAAHLHRPDLNMLDRMPDDPMHDVAYSEAGSKGYLLDAIVPFKLSLIIPGNFTKVSMFDDPLGDKRLTCSTARLRNILGRLEKEYWGGAVHPSAWLEGGLVFARDAVSYKQIGDQWMEEREPEPPDSLRGNAEFGFAVYTEMLGFSERHGAAVATSW